MLMGIHAPRRIEAEGGPIEGRPPVFGRVKDGCQHSVSCLTCPLPKCKYDEPPTRTDSRIAHVLRLYDAGVPGHEVAEVVGCSLRSVHRWTADREQT